MIAIAADGDFRRRSSSRFLVTALALTLTTVLGCSGSSGGGTGSPGRDGDTGTADPDEAPAPDGSDESGEARPTLIFSASPSAVAAGGFATLSWNSAHTDGCDASGAWSGGRHTAGVEEVGPIEAEVVFRLSCSGAGGGIARQVRITLDDGSGPTVSLRASPDQLAPNQATTLIWSSDRATTCSASGGWQGQRALSGRFVTPPLTETTSYTLSCSGEGNSALAATTVEVLDKTLRWQAPSQNVDGSPLTDLAGYVVYWGTDSRDYRSSHTIEDPAVTRWVADIAPGRYFFSLTALDREGHESGYSNEVRKTIP